eukprot:TRINITY_DN12212_c0_g1_i1.p2 TRINITY_DN12212_c0_g1~~TRINITY_DN12212_c0_g1_i1.p2  ORF type:complete len:138 (-),score=17.98 TRINITY_DN12212_c0_g1_i1:1175-1588(-)
MRREEGLSDDGLPEGPVPPIATADEVKRVALKWWCCRRHHAVKVEVTKAIAEAQRCGTGGEASRWKRHLDLHMQLLDVLEPYTRITEDEERVLHDVTVDVIRFEVPFYSIELRLRLAASGPSPAVAFLWGVPVVSWL